MHPNLHPKYLNGRQDAFCSATNVIYFIVPTVFCFISHQSHTKHLSLLSKTAFARSLTIRVWCSAHFTLKDRPLVRPGHSLAHELPDVFFRW